MKPIEELTYDDIKAIKLLVFDVDGVLVPRGSKVKQIENTTTFTAKIIDPRIVKKLRTVYNLGYKINISSGRGLYMLQMMFRPLLDFVSITFENGSGTYDSGVIKHYINSSKLHKIQLELENIKSDKILGYEPKEFIITIHCTERVLEIEKFMKEHDNCYCLWNGEAYDIGLGFSQTKGIGVLSLTDHLGLKESEVLAIGDNLNDRELLDAAGLKITADETRLAGDFSIPLLGEKLPGEVLLDRILKIHDK